MLSIGSAPILLRYYSPKEFGEYALSVSIGSILAVVMAGRLEMAIALPASDRIAQKIRSTARSASVLLSAAVLMLATLGYVFSFCSILPYLFGTSIGLLTSFIQIDTATLNRGMKYKKVAIMRLFQATTIAAIQITLAFCATGPNRLEIGNIAALLITNILFSVPSFCTGAKLPTRIYPRILIRYRQFILVDVWSSLLNAASSQLPIFLLGKYFSSEIVGYYSLAHRVLMLPVTLVSGNISMLFYQKASAQSRSTGIDYHRMRSQIIRLSMFGALFMALALGFSNVIIHFTFGPQWETSADIISILAPWIFFVLVASPFSGIFQIRGEQHFYLKANIILFSLRILVFIFVVALLNKWQYALLSYSMVSASFWLYLLIAKILPAPKPVA